jgi:hypothetical protein
MAARKPPIHPGGKRRSPSMLLAKIDCSDPECEGDLEIVIEDLNELHGLVCECGHGFVLTSVSELRPDDAKVVSIQFRQGRALRKLAA